MAASQHQLVLLDPIQADGPRPTAASLQVAACQAERLANALLDVARTEPNRTAIVVGSDEFSYGTIAHAALSTALFLKEQPTFETGQPVAMLLGNCPEYLAAFYGTLLAGGVTVPLPPTIEKLRLAKILDSCSVRTVLTSSHVAQRRGDLPADRPVSITLNSQSSPGPNQLGETPAESASLAMILFTSGSSGDPKGVMLSDANLRSNANSIAQYLPIDTSDRALALLPFYHAYGNSVLQTHVRAGATLVIDGNLAFPNTVVDAIRRHRVTSFSGVPEAYYSLLSYSDLRQPLPHLRYATVAGGALKRQSILDVASKIAPAKFYVMYGQSEATARLAYLPPQMLKAHPDSIGKAIPDVQLRVVNEEDEPVSPGVTGELCARGPNVMLGYWKDAGGTQASLKNGWLHTGDLATMDERGLFYIQARKNDLIKIQGLRTHPKEIEDVVAHSYSDCEVAAVPFPQGETYRLALYVVLGQKSSATTVDQLRAECVRELPRPKVPTHIEILDELPLNASMKVDRALLSRRAELQMSSTVGSPAASSMGKSCG